MKPTQTGIAVALALVVVLVFFMFPGLSPFGSINPADQEAAAIINDTDADTTDMSIQDTGELQMIDTLVGEGETAATGDTVTVTYVGSLTNGTVFDASANHGSGGFTFQLGAGQVIQGWDQGIVGMKVGGKRTLVIPAALAYGSAEVPGGSIPPNSTLVFEVELLGVQRQ